MNLEQLGLLGIFIAGATPWFEAIAAVPAGILAGLDPVLTLIAATTGNAVTTFLFAYAGSSIRTWLVKRREARGKIGDSPKYAKAQAAFAKYGIWVMAVLNPIIIGTQFAAAASVAAGVKPMKVSIVYTASAVIWAGLIAWAMVTLGIEIL